MKLKGLITLALLTMSLLKCSLSYSQQSRIVCLDRELVVQIIKDKKRSNVEREELKVYKNATEYLESQVAIFNTLMDSSQVKMQRMDSLIVYAHDTMDGIQMQLKAEQEKNARLKKRMRIGALILAGMVTLTTIF